MKPSKRNQARVEAYRAKLKGGPPVVSKYAAKNGRGVPASKPKEPRP
jgi:hypothetical protein